MLQLLFMYLVSPIITEHCNETISWNITNSGLSILFFFFSQYKKGIVVMNKMTACLKNNENILLLSPVNLTSITFTSEHE